MLLLGDASHVLIISTGPRCDCTIAGPSDLDFSSIIDNRQYFSDWYASTICIPFFFPPSYIAALLFKPPLSVFALFLQGRANYNAG